ncbi:MAG: patatin-like phospholipase family protein [Actinomycetota bacterium]|nr:patatin-like phospholipase family protein [Actinomycetota bacterium]
MADSPMPTTADFVLEGGGVRGIGHVGAFTAFAERGITPHRLAGVSAGAIVGSLLAAGITPERLHDAYLKQQYDKLLDPTWIRRLPIPFVNVWASRLFLAGEYKGVALREWIGARLSDPALLDGQPPIERWGQLRLDDPGADTSVVQNGTLNQLDSHYRLVIVANDVTRGPMMRFPWDYRYWYDLDPDNQSVPDAVYWSTAIPAFFQPGHLTSHYTGQDSQMVDGGLSSGFPVDIFDRHDGKPPRWPTFYIGLQTRLDPRQPVPNPPRRGLSYYTDSVLSSALDGRETTLLADPTLSRREILIPANDIDPNDFGISQKRLQALFQLGYDTAKTFLDHFSWDAYLGAATTRPRMP